MSHDITFYSDLLARHQYAFVDRVFTSAQTLEDMPVIPLVPKEMERDAGKMPALLPLAPDAPYMARLAARMKAGEDAPACNPVDTLIAVAPDIEQRRLESHLVSRLILSSAQWSRLFLRYYSSDVFPHLVRILPPVRLKSLFGPNGEVQQWTFRFQNDWITVPAPELGTKSAPPAWVLDGKRRDSLVIVGEVNSVLDAYREKRGCPWKDHAEWDDSARSAELLIGIAQRLGRLSDADDLKAFALHGLTHGERFYRHPTIENILRDAASRPGAYRAETDKLTNDEWAATAA